MAIVVDAKETPDRDGYLADGRALWGQEGVGAGSVAPNLTLAAQGVEPHHGCLLLPASWALAATLLRAPYPLNLHTGLATIVSDRGRRPNSPNLLEEVFHEVRCYSITSRMPSLIRFSSCAPTSPTIISGEVGRTDDRVLPTQSSANLFDLSAPARCSKMLIEVSVPPPLSSA